MKPAVVLLSGGVDSATTLAIAKEEGYEVFALSFRYGQRHEIEIDSAEQVAKSLGVSEHRVIEINLRGFGGSALTDVDRSSEKSRRRRDGRRNSRYLRTGAKHNLPQLRFGLG